MVATIRNLRRFPLKGAAGVQEFHLEVNPVVGVVNDRRVAVRRRPGSVTERPEPFRKSDYVVGVNTAAMVRDRPEFVPGSDFEPAPAYLEALGQHVREDLVVHNTHGEYNLADTKGPQVSFLNLATLRELEKFNRHIPIDPNRFRMNVWIEGLPAFAEYDWIDGYPGTREIRVGNVRMRVDDACERCKATHANPRTGEYDLQMVPLLKSFMEARGYKSPHRGVASVMGFYAVVLTEGTIFVGNDISLL